MYNSYRNDARQVSEEIVSLLLLCQQLQSEKDGVLRPAPGLFAQRDAFGDRINTACFNALRLQQSLPLMEQLTSLGKQMERQGKLSLQAGEDYATAVIAWFVSKCNQEIL